MGPRKRLNKSRPKANQKMITVSCAQHHQTLVDGLWNLRQTKRGLDLYFQWGGQSFETHQMLVDIFLSQEKLVLADFSTADHSDLLEQLLQFMYNGAIRIQSDRLDDLLDVAKRVDFTMLVDALELIKKGDPVKCTCGNVAHSGTTTAQPTYKENAPPPTNPIQGILSVRPKPSNATKNTSLELMNKDNYIQLLQRAPPEVAATITKTILNPKISEDETRNSSEVEHDTFDADYVTINCNESEHDDAFDGDYVTRDSSESEHDNADDADYTPETLPSKRNIMSPSKKNTPLTITTIRQRGRRRGNLPAEVKPTVVPNDAGSVDLTDAVSKLDDSGLPEIVSKRLKGLAERLPLPLDAYTSLPLLECPKCDFETTEFDSYRKHMKEFHRSTKGLGSEMDIVNQKRCPLCKFVADTNVKLETHWKAEHPGCTCPRCGFVFKYRSHLRTHVESCDGVRRMPQDRLPGERYPCELCSKTFLTNYRLKVHTKLVHLCEKLFMCHICGKSLSRQINLSNHMRVHTLYKPFVCEICGKSFSDRSTCLRHSRMVHTQNVTRIPCQKCSRSFKRADNLHAHVRQAHPEDGQQVKPNHRNKIIKHRNKPPGTLVRRSFTCCLCTEPPAIGFRAEMERHQMTKHPGEKIFKCDKCDYVTSCIPMLTIHGRKHSGIRPYKCKECGREFYDPSNYRNHLKFHTRGAKHLHCPTCPSAFHQRHNLKEHLNKVHKLTGDELNTVLATTIATDTMKRLTAEADVDENNGDSDEYSGGQDDEKEEDTHSEMVRLDQVIELDDPNLVYVIS